MESHLKKLELQTKMTKETHKRKQQANEELRLDNAQKSRETKETIPHPA